MLKQLELWSLCTALPPIGLELWPSKTTYRERSGSVVEWLTRDRGATGSRLTGVTGLCP